MATREFTVTTPTSLANVAPDVASDLAKDVARRTIGLIAGTDITVEDTTAAEAASDALDLLTNEFIRVAVNGTGGTFTLTFGAQTTGNLDFDATPTEVYDALVALSTLDAGDVAVSGGPGDDGATTPYYVQFVGSKRGTNVGAVTAADSLTGGAGTVTITVLQQGGLTIDADPV